MNRSIALATALLLLLATFAIAHDEKAPAPRDTSQHVYGEQLGEVNLPFECNEAVGDLNEQALALLHHMTYVGARSLFTEIAEKDPECALGYWGEAMSYIHPLWSDPPSAEDFVRGKALAAEAMKRAKGPKEKAFVAALQAYYGKPLTQSEKPNLKAFAAGWDRTYQQFPGDTEAATFFALTNLGIVDPSDKSYTKQRESARIGKQVLEREPKHPGAHHYTIHALDYPPLAQEALDVARSYGKIAPAVPHALHMPAHIFTRLGLWEESIDMNRRSADAALKHPAGGKISLHYLHALDYLAYAHLQRGDDQNAQRVLEEITALKGPYQTHVASAYSFAAIPARIALERQRWGEAAALSARSPENYPWKINPAMEAITYFANGLGAARSGNPEQARTAIEALKKLEESAGESSGYWSKQVAIQRLSVEAWLVFSRGDKEKGLRIMRQAASEEAATEKHPVTPGEVLPAHELLADMLMELKRYGEAGDFYLATLQRSPNRLNSLYGAGRAAELSGDETLAAFHYKALDELVIAGSDNRQAAHARAYLARR